MEHTMAGEAFKIGLIGVDPGRSWAASAHIPALRAQPWNFEIVGLANSSAESGQRAAEASGIAAFESVDDMLRSAAVDVVAITVKVPAHRDLALKALEAGKHVYCEWPLGNGLAEARELATCAGGKLSHAVVGTQARRSPVMRYAADLIAQGYVGEVLSTTLVGSGGPAGPKVARANAYTLDVTNGANLLTIPFGHAMAAISDALGDVAVVSAELATRRRLAHVIDTGEEVVVTSPDQVLVAGVLANGAPLSVHYRGGISMGTDLLWEVSGTRGVLQVKAATGHIQMAELSLFGFSGQGTQLAPIAVPEHYYPIQGLEQPIACVAYLYHQLATDLREETRTAPSFEDAVATHRLIAAIEEAARTGRRVALDGIE